MMIFNSLICITGRCCDRLVWRAVSSAWWNFGSQASAGRNNIWPKSRCKLKHLFPHYCRFTDIYIWKVKIMTLYWGSSDLWGAVNRSKTIDLILTRLLTVLFWNCSSKIYNGKLVFSKIHCVTINDEEWLQDIWFVGVSGFLDMLYLNKIFTGFQYILYFDYK